MKYETLTNSTVTLAASFQQKSAGLSLIVIKGSLNNTPTYTLVSTQHYLFVDIVPYRFANYDFRFTNISQVAG